MVNKGKAITIAISSLLVIGSATVGRRTAVKKKKFKTDKAMALTPGSDKAKKDVYEMGTKIHVPIYNNKDILSKIKVVDDSASASTSTGDTDK
ncbi:MAG: hypothetical protein Q4E24_03485 [bacterium]|nr:hypothetical protein [bacterium]